MAAYDGSSTLKCQSDFEEDSSLASLDLAGLVGFTKG